MKRVLLFFILIYSSVSISQSWKYESGGNAFDGKYKTASVKGTGTDFPYHKPLMVVNLYNEMTLNFYIASAGFFQSSYVIEILWIFNNEPNTIYETYDFSLSADGKIIFLTTFKNSKTGTYLRQLEFIEKLKLANKVDIRIKTKYTKNDLQFSLAGSTRAIDYTVSKKYIQKQNDFIESIRNQLNKEIDLKVGLGMLLIDKEIFVYEERSKLIKNIFDQLDNNLPIIESIVSLEFELLDNTTELRLFNKDDELVCKVKFIEDIIPKTVGKNRSRFKRSESNQFSKQNKIETTGFQISNMNGKKFGSGLTLYENRKLELDSVKKLEQEILETKRKVLLNEKKMKKDSTH